MECEDAKALQTGSIFEAEFFTDGGLLGDRQEVTQRVDHHVADHEYAFPRTAFFQEVGDGIFLGDEEIVGDGVGEDAVVDLLGHGAVKAAKVGLDVLAGVDEDGVDFRMALHLVHERRDFRKIGARADDIEDFQALGHGAFVSGVRGQ